MAQQALPRVLVAGTHEAIELVRLVLAGEVTLVPALSVEAAVQRLDATTQLILCNVRFDDSRMFDFLGALQEGAYRRVPVVCFRSEHSSLQPAMEKSLALALAELGIAAFVDLPALAQGKDMEAAMAQLRRHVLEALKKNAASGTYAVAPGRRLA
jgi:hypothetical protein